MQHITKGIKTKNRILTEANKVYNKKGTQLTLQELAKEIDISVSIITNHFRTKDHLIAAIVREYETRFQDFSIQFEANATGNAVEVFVKRYAGFMDIQYDYRAILNHINMITNSQKVIFKQITSGYKANKERLKARITYLVGMGVLAPEILEPEAFNLFSFTFLTLITTWMTYLQLYDHEQKYHQKKPVFLKGILSPFQPHFTKKGKLAFNNLDFEEICAPQ